MKNLKKVYETEKATIFKAVMPPVGVNTYLLYMGDHLFIVDPGIGSSELPGENHIAYTDITIIITHSHFDHITGIDEFPQCDVLISLEALPGLSDPSINLSGDFGGGTTIIQNKNTQTLTQGENNWKGCSFDVMIYPGHTQGDTVIDFGDFMFTGDFVFCNSIGRTDFPFSDTDKMKQSLIKFRKALSKKDSNTLLLPGHMGTCSAKELLENNVYLSIY